MTDGARSVALAVIAPAIAVTLWGAFVAPKASRRLNDPARAVVELGVFAAAVAALLAAHHVTYAVILAVAAVGSAVLTRVFDAEKMVAGSVGG